MATIQVTGSFTYTLPATFADVHVCHANQEISFWEQSGLAYSVEITIDGQTAAPLDIPAGASPFWLAPSPSKSYSFQFEGAAGAMAGYAS